MKNILVFGFYNANNLGDELFKSAFIKLFPLYKFIFVSHISLNSLKDIDVVFFGGGSFLETELNISNDALDYIKSKPIFYIGVGSETYISSIHKELIKLAKLVAIRTNANINNILDLNKNVMVMPDLVYHLSSDVSSLKIKKSVCVIPNISVVPRWNQPHWKHISWDYFKIEFAQFLDELIDNKYTINFFQMCDNYDLNDNYAATEIISRMTKLPNRKLLLDKCTNISSATEVLSKYEIVISQRYHGAVLANMSKVPCLTIYHHDKLKDVYGTKISYYSSCKDTLRKSFNKTLTNIPEILPIDCNIFITLKQKVENAICGY